MSCHALLIFPGQGSQHLQMLSKGGIYDMALSSEFRPVLEYCSDLISSNVVDLIENGPEEDLNQTSITQPVLMMTSYLHFQKLNQKIDLKISAMAGHSLGEYTALVVSNSLSIYQALDLVRKRGLLMEEATKGSMAAILGIDFSVIEKLCVQASEGDHSEVQCATLNSPSQTVISGHHDAVQRAQDLCLSNGAKRALKLNVSIASHSRLMKSISTNFSHILDSIQFVMPEIPIFHNVSADIASDLIDLKRLLAQQLYSPVQWVKTCKKIQSHDTGIIECGPGKVLTNLAKANNLTNYLSSTDEGFYDKIALYGK